MGIKAPKIYFLMKGQVKLSDFGGAARIGQQINTFNKHYSAPEVIFTAACTETSDVYSLGVIIAQLITRRAAEDLGEVPRRPRPSTRDDRNEHISVQTNNAIRRQRYNIHNSISVANRENQQIARSLIELAGGCMRHYANQRPRIEEVVQTLAEL
ncbi:hypothetical protein Salat_0416100 [Sesamum alatum]|uniref:Protein kinase domain-containing protein n=1 Tax=Sesamum alatum TaxID=300844 RepID=A0AAE1Z2V2_9LAMI|nr:hypothetical protein Salat_0416100 [Sesamum alatum]